MASFFCQPDLETEEIGLSPVLQPSKKASVKEEVAKTSGAKVSAPNVAAARTTPGTAGKGKRKSIADEGKVVIPPSKKLKPEQPQVFIWIEFHRSLHFFLVRNRECIRSFS